MSLKARLLLAMGLVAVVLVVATVAITRATESNLIDQVDRELARSTPQLRSDRRPGGITSFDNDDRPPTALYVAVVDPSADELATLFLPGTTATSASPPDISTEDALARVGEGTFTVNADDSELRYRAVVQQERPGGRALLVALPLEDVDAAIDQLVRIQVMAAAAILATLGLVTFWVLRLGVRPVKRMADAAAAMGAGDLSQRIPEAPEGTEAGELGVALNQMLGRIEGAFDEQARTEDRLRRFVADASHELRTPITTIQGYAELFRMGGLDADTELDEAMRRTEQEAGRMGHLVNDLLALARFDQGRAAQLGTVDAAGAATDAVADAQVVSPERPVTYDGPSRAPVTADEALVRQVLANLVANARVHTDPGTPITVRVAAGPATTTLEVADEGPGMAPEVAERAFERFYRADPARTRHRGGSGLGLSIVASAVAAMGGSVALDSRPGHGTTVRVELPTAHEL